MLVTHIVRLNQEELTQILKLTLFKNLNVNFKFDEDNIVVDYTEFFDVNMPIKIIKATLQIPDYKLLIIDEDDR